jgi:hypothetical protein
MDETNPASASARVAVECLTMWLEQDRQRAIDHIAHLEVDPSGPGPTNLIVGLLNLSSWLVLTFASAQPATSEDELREKAGVILREFLRQLPE